MQWDLDPTSESACGFLGMASCQFYLGVQSPAPSTTSSLERQQVDGIAWDLAQRQISSAPPLAHRQGCSLHSSAQVWEKLTHTLQTQTSQVAQPS